MWFEILPSGIIICSFIALPQFFNGFYNKAVFGNPYRRDLNEMWDRHQFTRDVRIGGGPWMIKGIENIPDGKDL